MEINKKMRFCYVYEWKDKTCITAEFMIILFAFTYCFVSIVRQLREHK